MTTGAGVTGDAANLDGEVSQDSGAYTNITAAEVEVGNGQYYVELTAAEMTGSSVSVAIKTSTANVFEPVVNFDFEPGVDSGVLQAGASQGGTLRSAAVATDDYYNGCDIEIVRGTGIGQTRRITDYTGSSKVFVTDRAWAVTPDNTSVYLIHPYTGPGLNTLIDGNADVRCAGGITGSRTDFGAALNYGALGNLNSFVNGGVPTTTSFITGLSSSVTDAYKDGTIQFASGALRGEASRITAYNGSTKAVTVSPAFSAAPTDQDTFFITGLFLG